jgi:hypothetical protein
MCHKLLAFVYTQSICVLCTEMSAFSGRTVMASDQFAHFLIATTARLLKNLFILLFCTLFLNTLLRIFCAKGRRREFNVALIYYQRPWFHKLCFPSRPWSCQQLNSLQELSSAVGNVLLYNLIKQ